MASNNLQAVVLLMSLALLTACAGKAVHSTEAECVPGSRYAVYLKHLNKADSFFFQATQLILKPIMDQGHLVFENGGVVSQLSFGTATKL